MAFVSNKNDSGDNITCSQTLLPNKDAHIAIWFTSFMPLFLCTDIHNFT